MSSYNLRYFDLIARAEPIKILLTYGGASWTHETPNWPQDKSNQTVGKLPVLLETTPDGKTFSLSESMAIEWYLATKFNLLPTNNPQYVARQIELRSQTKDVYDLMLQYRGGPESARESIYENLKTRAKFYIDYHEKVLKENGSNGHYFGNEISYADIATYGMFCALHTFVASFMPQAVDLFTKDKAPELNRLYETIAREKKLAKYVQSLKK
ncbi:hypothetical protein GGI07_002104 [Coemansia sp. Benny D115]|nr:hypothetical protein GGI07_002104 [Coemansia sp. Benny D115]